MNLNTRTVTYVSELRHGNQTRQYKTKQIDVIYNKYVNRETQQV